MLPFHMAANVQHITPMAKDRTMMSSSFFNMLLIYTSPLTLARPILNYFFRFRRFVPQVFLAVRFAAGGFFFWKFGLPTGGGSKAVTTVLHFATVVL